MDSESQLMSHPEIYVDTELLPKVSPRTQLFPLQPNGIESSEVESLDSYFERLADAHRVSPIAFYKEVLSPPLGELSATWRQSNAYRVQGPQAINGYGSLSIAWVRVLTEMTGIPTLRACGLGGLDGILSNEGLFRRQLRYCPYCLNSSDDYKTFYKRLLWTFSCVDACPIHSVQLIDHKCDAPKREEVPFAFRKLLFGICARCGSVGYRCNRFTTCPASDTQVWRAVQIGQLLSLLPFAERIFSKKLLTLGVLDLLRSMRTGRLNSDLSSSRISKATLSAWANGGSPRIDLLLNLCGAAGVSLVSIMKGAPEPSRYTGAGVIPRNLIRKLGPEMEIRKTALEVALSSEGEPLSVSAVARQLGVDRTDLNRRFPGLSTLVAEKFMRFEREQRAAKKKELVAECRKLIRQLEEQGLKPTYKRIQTASGIVNMPQSMVRKVLDELL